MPRRSPCPQGVPLPPLCCCLHLRCSVPAHARQIECPHRQQAESQPRPPGSQPPTHGARCSTASRHAHSSQPQACWRCLCARRGHQRCNATSLGLLQATRLPTCTTPIAAPATGNMIALASPAAQADSRKGGGASLATAAHLRRGPSGSPQRPPRGHPAQALRSAQWRRR